MNVYRAVARGASWPRGTTSEDRRFYRGSEGRSPLSQLAPQTAVLSFIFLINSGYGVIVNINRASHNYANVVLIICSTIPLGRALRRCELAFAGAGISDVVLLSWKTSLVACCLCQFQAVLLRLLFFHSFFKDWMQV